MSQKHYSYIFFQGQIDNLAFRISQNKLHVSWYIEINKTIRYEGLLRAFTFLPNLILMTFLGLARSPTGWPEFWLHNISLCRYPHQCKICPGQWLDQYVEFECFNFFGSFVSHLSILSGVLSCTVLVLSGIIVDAWRMSFCRLCCSAHAGVGTWCSATWCPQCSVRSHQWGCGHTGKGGLMPFWKPCILGVPQQPNYFKETWQNHSKKCKFLHSEKLSSWLSILVYIQHMHRNFSWSFALITQLRRYRIS